jgi:hypothetical protein
MAGIQRTFHKVQIPREGKTSLARRVRFLGRKAIKDAGFGEKFSV